MGLFANNIEAGGRKEVELIPSNAREDTLVEGRIASARKESHLRNSSGKTVTRMTGHISA